MNLSDPLRTAVLASGLTAYAIAKASGLRIQIVSRWLKGERDIYLATADKIVEGLGLRVSIKTK